MRSTRRHRYRVAGPGGLRTAAPLGPPAREGWPVAADAARSPPSGLARGPARRPSWLRRRRGRSIGRRSWQPPATVSIRPSSAPISRRPTKTAAARPPATTTPTRRGHQTRAMIAPTVAAGPASTSASAVRRPRSVPGPASIEAQADAPGAAPAPTRGSRTSAALGRGRPAAGCASPARPSPPRPRARSLSLRGRRLGQLGRLATGGRRNGDDRRERGRCLGGGMLGRPASRRRRALLGSAARHRALDAGHQAGSGLDLGGGASGSSASAGGRASGATPGLPRAAAGSRRVRQRVEQELLARRRRSPAGRGRSGTRIAVAVGARRTTSTCSSRAAVGPDRAASRAAGRGAEPTRSRRAAGPG